MSLVDIPGKSHVLDVLQGRVRRVGPLDDGVVRGQWRPVHPEGQDTPDALLVLVHYPVAHVPIFHSEIMKKN